MPLASRHVAHSPLSVHFWHRASTAPGRKRNSACPAPPPSLPLQPRVCGRLKAAGRWQAACIVRNSYKPSHRDRASAVACSTPRPTCTARFDTSPTAPPLSVLIAMALPGPPHLSTLRGTGGKIGPEIIPTPHVCTGVAVRVEHEHASEWWEKKLITRVAEARVSSAGILHRPNDQRAPHAGKRCTPRVSAPATRRSAPGS